MIIVNVLSKFYAMIVEITIEQNLCDWDSINNIE